MAEYYYVRFQAKGVWNSSDPFRTAEEAKAYAAWLRRLGGISTAEARGPIRGEVTNWMEWPAQ